jgi:cis-L-3-hydroxyproline dehydratase
MSILEGRILVPGGGSTEISHLVTTTVGLSFWGGIDPETGKVIDTSHPWHGQNVANTIMCLPSGRGSCTASQVLLELILNDRAPRAIVLRDVDAMACVGALVASSVFEKKVPDIICLGTDYFNQLLESEARFGQVTPGGQLLIGNSEAQIRQIAQSIKSDPQKALGLTMSEEEVSMMESTENEGERMAMRVLIAYARITSPDHATYLPISKVHVDGCTYIGPGGLEYVQRLVAAGAKVHVPTTLNSGSADRRQWQALGVPQGYAHNAIALGDAYLQLGCQMSFTCAPYLLDDPPKLGEDVAWGESNAVVYANTVLGARTEKYADYLDICCAILGKTVATGVHLEENRQPCIILDASELLAELWEHREMGGIDALFPTLGHLCGTLSDGQLPILVGMQRWNEFVTTDHLKAFCAAYGTTGSSPLIHIAGITPEANDPGVVQQLLADSGGRTRTLTMNDLQSTYETLDPSTDNANVDLVALGNPHLSLSECEDLVKIISDLSSTKSDTTRIMACMSRTLYSEAKELGHITPLEAFGMEFVNDTCWCMLLDPPVIPVKANATIMTNSGKYAHYGPGLTQRSFRFGSMGDCIQAAVTGTYSTRSTQALPRWLATSPTKRSYSTGLALNIARQFLRRQCVP